MLGFDPAGDVGGGDLQAIAGEQEQELPGGAVGAAGVGGAEGFIGFGNLSGCAKSTI